MKRIYIIGPLTPRGKRQDTDNPAIEYLFNASEFIDVAITLIDKGWAPFCAGLDMQYFLNPRARQVMTEARIKAISIAWEDVCQAVVLLPRWETSPGAKAEFQRAIELAIPIYLSVSDVPDEDEL